MTGGVAQWITDAARVLLGFGACVAVALAAVWWRYRAGRRDRDDEVLRWRFRMLVRQEQARRRQWREQCAAETVRIPRQRQGCDR